MNTENWAHKTRTWLKNFIIAHNICPFAKREFDRDSIRYCVISTATLEDCLATLSQECQYLDQHPECETSLLILTQGYADFSDFLNLLDCAEELVSLENYEGVYQIASFHPAYCFADAAQDDPGNYTNRSPQPMLHLIREASIATLIDNGADTDRIPERNVAYLRALGEDAIQRILTESTTNTDD